MSDALDRAARLTEMGIEIRSVELREEAERLRTFNESGGNRRMRRAAKRAAQTKGNGKRRYA